MSQILSNDKTEEPTSSSTESYGDVSVKGTVVYESTYELKNVKHGGHDSPFESIKYDMVDLVDPIRLAVVGDRYPYHTSTQGVVLYKKRGSDHGFLMLGTGLFCRRRLKQEKKES